MLVLSRKVGEAILLNQNVTIEILSVEGERVRLGIQAPEETRIIRRELLEETIYTNLQSVNAAIVSFDDMK